jgi:hypothetical protein
MICIKHSWYKGDEPPILTCKMCCAIYIREVRNVSVSEEWRKQNKTETCKNILQVGDIFIDVHGDELKVLSISNDSDIPIECERISDGRKMRSLYEEIAYIKPKLKFIKRA